MKNLEKEYIDWKRYGDDIKNLRNELLRIACNPEYQSLLKSKSINSYLIKASEYIDKFKDRAEEKMLSKVNPPFDDKRWINIFYGTEDR